VTRVTVLVVEFTAMARPRRSEPAVAGQILLLQVLVVAVLVATVLALAAYDARRDARAGAEARSVAVARAVADSPTVVDAIDDADPTPALQPYAEQVRVDAGVDFVVVMDLDRTRWTHPDPTQIGKPFLGTLGRAPQGGVNVEEFTGTLGASVRAVVPVERDGDVVALVSVGITVERIDRALNDDVFLIAVTGLLVLLAGLASTWLVARRLRRMTHGLGAAELSRMYEYHSAVLHAVREGLLLLDDEDRVQLANDEAVRLLDLPADVTGRSVHDLGLPPGLVAAAVGRSAESDDIYAAGDRLLVVSSSPATTEGRTVGAVVTLRDHTELSDVTGALEVTQSLTESLRAQTHEAANRLHTVVSLIEMGRPDDAVDFATEELATAQQLADTVVAAVGDPVVAALLLGKSSDAADRGVELRILGELPPDHDVPGRDLVTVVGNLVDNAFDAVRDHDRRVVEVRLSGSSDAVEVTVGDTGPGLTEEEAELVLGRGWTTKVSTGPAGGRGVGLALVAQVARRHAGAVSIGRSELGGAEFRVVLHPAGRASVVP
jgi:two-component system CitB family sensor kinase